MNRAPNERIRYDGLRKGRRTLGLLAPLVQVAFLALGFGISKPEHVEALREHVDAVVVGSAIVRQIEKDPSKLEAFMRDLTRPLAATAV